MPHDHEDSLAEGAYGLYGHLPSKTPAVPAGRL